MIKKFKKFLLIPSEEKKLFLEAYLFLGIMRTALLTVSFKRLTRSLEHLPNKEEITLLNEEAQAKGIAVGQAIARAAAYTPWESACLVQSLSAQKMLKKRGISGRFYLGVTKDEKNKKEMKAHAWTQCGEDIIIGAGQHEEYTVLSSFGWGKR